MKIKVGIIGGSGYTGIELLRIIHQHPNAEVHAITSRALEGRKISEVFPNMHGISELTYLLPDDNRLFECDIVFFATPHGVAMNNAALFLKKILKLLTWEQTSGSPMQLPGLTGTRWNIPKNLFLKKPFMVNQK